MDGHLAGVGLLCAFTRAQAVSPAPDGCYPNFTTAEGCGALNSLTTGAANTGTWLAFALFDYRRQFQHWCWRGSAGPQQREFQYRSGRCGACCSTPPATLTRPLEPAPSSTTRRSFDNTAIRFSMRSHKPPAGLQYAQSGALAHLTENIAFGECSTRRALSVTDRRDAGGQPPAAATSVLVTW